MRFKVGDKVRVKDIEGVTGNMKDMVGELVTIKSVEEYNVDGINYSWYEIEEDFGEYEWQDDMLTPIETYTHEEVIEQLGIDPLATKIEELNNKPVKMISGENLLNESDPIKPEHYRKGEIDLFESWYRTYPFNEFRAGMQMIAERYMKRDKHDRVEDIKKSVETLTRLKEYEEMERSEKSFE